VSEMLAFLQNHGGAISILVAIATALIATRFVTKEQHEKAVSSLDAKFIVALDKLDKAEDRIARVEQELGHLPSRETVHRMEISLANLNGEMRALGEQLKPVASISERLQEFLLEQANRR